MTLFDKRIAESNLLWRLSAQIRKRKYSTPKDKPAEDVLEEIAEWLETQAEAKDET